MSGQESVHSFPLVDRYTGTRLDVDLSALEARRLVVVESPRRLRRESNYGFLHAFWWIQLADGQAAVSVPPGAGSAVRAILGEMVDGGQPAVAHLAAQLKDPINAPLRAAGLPEVDRLLCDVVFACNASLLRQHRRSDCRRLRDDSVPPAAGLKLPTHCFPDGIVYGVVIEDQVVSVAYAHRTGVMEDRVADLAVGTAADHQQRGYAKASVSAVVAHIAETGGEARYGCRPDNAASIATARSVGFVPYASSIILSATVADPPS